MEIGVAEPILKHKNIKGSMGQQYLNPIRWEKTIFLLHHIHGSLAIFPFLCNRQDTESE